MAKENKIEIKNLREKLETLSGVDFEEAEREEMQSGNKADDVTMTRSYAIRIAARALGVKPVDLKKFPVLEYLAIIRQVNNFFLSGLTKDKILFNQSDDLPSDFESSAE